ncbi:MAG: DUF6263 family protein [Gemmataceae bacterium]
MSPRLLVGSALALCFLSAPLSAQTKLAFKFKKGEKQQFVFEQKMKIVTTVNGMDINTKVDQSIEKTWEVLSVDAKGTAKVRIKFDRVKFAMEGFTGVVEIDSKNLKDAKGDVEKVLNQVVAAMAATDMTLSVDPTGEVRDVELTEAARAKLKELPTGDAGGVGGFANEGQIKAMASAGVTFPAAGVEKGKTWSHKQTIESPIGKVLADSTHSYEGEIDRDGQKLDEITTKQDVKIEAAADAKIKIKMKSMEGKGKAYFDRAAGRLIEQTSQSDIEMEVEAGGMTIQQRIGQSTTMRLKK